MKTLRSLIAVILSVLLTAEPVRALAVESPAAKPIFGIQLPNSIGFVTEEWAPSAPSETPDFILLQDLHVNRSVQFAISKILKSLKKQGMLPRQIAVEGDAGPVDISSMQTYSDARIKKEACDYLVRQGEMPGAMHFAVTDGAGQLFGIETDEFYKANLEMFRRSYAGRSKLRGELEKIQAVLPKLRRDAASRENALVLEKEIQAVNLLINNQVTPAELSDVLRRATAAVDHLKLVLPEQGDFLADLSAAINFYSFALIRDEELASNALTLHKRNKHVTSVVITGGFHTHAIAEELKKNGYSYAVITPNVRRHTKVDEKLYTEGLLGHTLSYSEASSGVDRASMMLARPFPMVNSLFEAFSGYRALYRKNPIKETLRTLTFVVTFAVLMACKAASPTAPTPTVSPASTSGPVISDLPAIGTVIQITQSQGDASWANGQWTFQAGDVIRAVFPSSAAGNQVLARSLPDRENPNLPIGLNRTPMRIPAAAAGSSQTEVRFRVEDFGLPLGILIGQLSTHSNSAPFNVSLGAGNQVVIPIRLELIRSGVASNPTPTQTVGTAFTEEFNGSAGTPPNPAVWTYDLGGGGWGNNEQEIYTDSTENVRLDGSGNLVIRAVRQANGTITSGRIKTQGRVDFEYGKIEASISLPGGQGVWPAFWMLGSDFNGSNWPTIGEIDIVEGIRGQILSAVHGPGYSGAQGLARTFGALQPNTFHTYAVEWTPGRIAFAVDGNVYHIVTRSSLPGGATWVSDRKNFVVLNVAMGGNPVGSTDSSTPNPAEMKVAYLRVTPLTATSSSLRASPDDERYRSIPGQSPDRNRNTGRPIASILERATQPKSLVDKILDGIGLTVGTNAQGLPQAPALPTQNPAELTRTIVSRFEVVGTRPDGGTDIAMTSRRRLNRAERGSTFNLHPADQLRFVFPTSMAGQDVDIALSIASEGIHTGFVKANIDVNALVTIPISAFRKEAFRSDRNGDLVPREPYTDQEINRISDITIGLPKAAKQQGPLVVQVIPGLGQVQQVLERATQPRPLVDRILEGIGFSVAMDAQTLPPGQLPNHAPLWNPPPMPSMDVPPMQSIEDQTVRLMPGRGDEFVMTTAYANSSRMTIGHNIGKRNGIKDDFIEVILSPVRSIDKLPRFDFDIIFGGTFTGEGMRRIRMEFVKNKELIIPWQMKRLPPIANTKYLVDLLEDQLPVQVQATDLVDPYSDRQFVRIIIRITKEMKAYAEEIGMPIGSIYISAEKPFQHVINNYRVSTPRASREGTPIDQVWKQEGLDRLTLLDRWQNLMFVFLGIFKRSKGKDGGTPAKRNSLQAPKISEANIAELRQIVQANKDPNLLGVVLYVSTEQSPRVGVMRIKNTGLSFMVENPQDTNFDFIDAVSELRWVDTQPMAPLLRKADWDTSPYQSLDMTLSMFFLPVALSGGRLLNFNSSADYIVGAWGVVGRSAESEEELRNLIQNRMDAITGTKTVDAMQSPKKLPGGNSTLKSPVIIGLLSATLAGVEFATYATFASVFMAGILGFFVRRSERRQALHETLVRVKTGLTNFGRGTQANVTNFVNLAIAKYPPNVRKRAQANFSKFAVLVEA